jgi:hypothetical protein
MRSLPFWRLIAAFSAPVLFLSAGTFLGIGAWVGPLRVRPNPRPIPGNRRLRRVPHRPGVADAGKDLRRLRAAGRRFRRHPIVLSKGVEVEPGHP